MNPSINIKKEPGPITKPATILKKKKKKNQNLPSDLLSPIIDLSFKQGLLYPNCLKIAKATPIFKNNILTFSPAFSQLLQKAVRNRVYFFLCKFKMINAEF